MLARRSVLGIGLSLGAAFVAAPARAIIDHRPPDLALTLAVVIAGGGPGRFRAARLLGVLAGPKS
ncbi:MAG: hypothetical protein ACREM8_10270, partial [Vulcanimicrobiaceae bacterium]